MSQLKLRDGTTLLMIAFDDFLLLRNLPKHHFSLPVLGQAIFSSKVDGIDEVIATEIEILLKVSGGFELGSLTEIELDKNESTKAPRQIDLPIAFADPDEDWERISSHTGLSRATYIQQLLKCEFHVAMPGFLPGFIYLNGLPDALHVPRKDTPAKRTDAGAFAIGGKYGGIYSLSSPAGWNVVGHTARQLFQLNHLPPLSVSAGDRIKLRIADGVENAHDDSKHELPTECKEANGQLTFLKPGLLTLLQDHGRQGLAFYAIPPSGCLDRDASELANAILGNSDHAAVIECHFVAPTIRFDTSAMICLTGSDMNWKIDGESIRTNRSFRIKSGSMLSGSASRNGCRSYIGICGEIDSQRTFESVSCYPLASFGGNQGKAFKSGDVLKWKPPGKTPPTLKYKKWEPQTKLDLKVAAGPESDWLDETSRTQLYESEFTISTESNRMGARLVGPKLSTSNLTILDSVPLLPGMIQLTPSGQCIVVLQDGQTTGGYPRIGYLSSSELQKLSQIQPRNPFVFTQE